MRKSGIKLVFGNYLLVGHKWTVGGLSYSPLYHSGRRMAKLSTSSTSLAQEVNPIQHLHVLAMTEVNDNTNRLYYNTSAHKIEQQVAKGKAQRRDH